MKIESNCIVLEEIDLKEIFALFSSCTSHEKAQIYDTKSLHYFERDDIDQVCELSLEKREIARDVWRAVITFLSRREIILEHRGERMPLDFIEADTSEL